MGGGGGCVVCSRGCGAGAESNVCSVREQIVSPGNACHHFMCETFFEPNTRTSRGPEDRLFRSVHHRECGALAVLEPKQVCGAVASVVHAYRTQLNPWNQSDFSKIICNCPTSLFSLLSPDCCCCGKLHTQQNITDSSAVVRARVSTCRCIRSLLGDLSDP